MSLGISLMVKAGIGTSPISSFPYVLSLRFQEISLGTFTFAWNIVLIIGQILILRKDFKIIEWMQIPISVLFGVFVDFTKSMLSGLNPHNYVFAISILIIGCVTLAFGVSLTVLSGVIMNSGEGFVKAVSIKSKKDFGNMKVVFDVSLVILSVVTSLIFFGKISGVREGTIIAALISGFIIRFFNGKLKFIVDRVVSDTYKSVEV